LGELGILLSDATSQCDFAMRLRNVTESCYCMGKGWRNIDARASPTERQVEIAKTSA